MLIDKLNIQNLTTARNSTLRKSENPQSQQMLDLVLASGSLILQFPIWEMETILISVLPTLHSGDQMRWYLKNAQNGASTW